MNPGIRAPSLSSPPHIPTRAWEPHRQSAKASAAAGLQDASTDTLWLIPPPFMHLELAPPVVHLHTAQPSSQASTEVCRLEGECAAKPGPPASGLIVGPVICLLCFPPLCVCLQMVPAITLAPIGQLAPYSQLCVPLPIPVTTAACPAP